MGQRTTGATAAGSSSSTQSIEQEAACSREKRNEPTLKQIAGGSKQAGGNDACSKLGTVDDPIEQIEMHCSSSSGGWQSLKGAPVRRRIRGKQSAPDQPTAAPDDLLYGGCHAMAVAQVEHHLATGTCTDTVTSESNRIVSTTAVGMGCEVECKRRRLHYSTSCKRQCDEFGSPDSKKNRRPG